MAVSSVGAEASERVGHATATLPGAAGAAGTWWGQMGWARGGLATAFAASARSAQPASACGGPHLCLTLLLSGAKAAAGGCSARDRGRAAASTWGRYLVDSASSHMLVSKIKPCMSKYKQVYCETANGSLNQLSFI